MISETQLEAAYFISVSTKLSPNIPVSLIVLTFIYRMLGFESHEDLSLSSSRKIPNMPWE
jgi:hypothetical protein